MRGKFVVEWMLRCLVSTLDYASFESLTTHVG